MLTQTCRTKNTCPKQKINLPKKRRLEQEESVRDVTRVMRNSVQRICAWTRDVHPVYVAQR